MLPLARAHTPSLLLVSAGFDSAEGDPQGDMRITPAGFGRLAALLLDELKLPTVFALEGGYVCCPAAVEHAGQNFSGGRPASSAPTPPPPLTLPARDRTRR